ncbi:gamma-aminobutyric acid receptor subunit theta [Ctenodactylus gundi]
MGFGRRLRAATILLLMGGWLAESNGPNPNPKFHFEFSSSTPPVILDLFHCKNCANETVVHKILDRVLSRYDVRLRPNFGGPPVPVKISIYVVSIEQISEINMDYTITMIFHQTWKDSRLAYHETSQNLTLDYRMHEKLWVPDCYFLNSKEAFLHDVTVENRVFRLHPDGTVQYGIRLTTKAACSLDLQNFPMDKQLCTLEVESYGYTVEDIVLSWEDGENAVYMTEKLQIPQFTFLGSTITSKEVYFYTGSYVRLILKFQVQREIKTYLVQIYWPTVLTTSISWISFWMNYDSSAARVTIGLTSILILTTIDSHLRDKLPNVSCVKAIDIYILVCLFFVFLSLLEYIYINYLYFSQGPRRERRRRRRPRRRFPRFHYEEVVMRNVQDDVINMEEGAGSLPTRLVLARLASPESFCSLESISEQVQLATSESLSSLPSISGQAQLAVGESLSDLPSTSQQALPGYGLPFNDSVSGRAEVQGSTDCDEDDLTWDESLGRGPSGRPVLPRVQRCVLPSGGDLDRIEILSDEVSVDTSDASSFPDLDSDADSIWYLDDDELMACDPEKDSCAESEESLPLSPGCAFKAGFSLRLFNPDHVPKVDKWSRFLFPLCFGLFNVVYWTYHLY